MENLNKKLQNLSLSNQEEAVAGNSSSSNEDQIWTEVHEISKIVTTIKMDLPFVSMTKLKKYCIYVITDIERTKSLFQQGVETVVISLDNRIRSNLPSKFYEGALHIVFFITDPIHRTDTVSLDEVN